MDRRIEYSFDTWLHGMSGSISSVLTTLILYPIENARTRKHILEQQTGKEEKLLEILKQIYQKEGIQGLYNGIMPLLMGNFISYGIYFFWYELFKNYFGTDIPLCLGYTKAAFLSGIITTLGSNPFWVIQTRMTFQKQRDNFLQLSYKMAKNEGITSFFKGFEASLGLVFNPIIQFIIYENLKKRLCSGYIPKFIMTFFSAAFAKTIATIFTYPYQVIRAHAHLSQSALNAAFMLTLYELIFKAIRLYVASHTKMLVQAI